MDDTELALRQKIAAEILAEAQFEGVRAQRIIRMCAAKVLRGSPPDPESDGSAHLTNSTANASRLAAAVESLESVRGATSAPRVRPTATMSDENKRAIAAAATPRTGAPLHAPTTAQNMTTNEVADYFRTSPETVRYWRHIGKGPKSFKVGRRVLYAREDVEAFRGQES